MLLEEKKLLWKKEYEKIISTAVFEQQKEETRRLNFLFAGAAGCQVDMWMCL